MSAICRIQKGATVCRKVPPVPATACAINPRNSSGVYARRMDWRPSSTFTLGKHSGATALNSTSGTRCRTRSRITNRRQARPTLRIISTNSSACKWCTRHTLTATSARGRASRTASSWRIGNSLTPPSGGRRSTPSTSAPICRRIFSSNPPCPHPISRTRRAACPSRFNARRIAAWLPNRLCVWESLRCARSNTSGSSPPPSRISSSKERCISPYNDIKEER